MFWCEADFSKIVLIIGDKVRMFLAAEYPSKLNILFPDSTHNFAPFEFEKRIYFPTKTTGEKSYDSVVYYLTTFEIDRFQALSLPVFQLNPMDCTVYFSRQDTILLTELVKNLARLTYRRKSAVKSQYRLPASFLPPQLSSYSYYSGRLAGAPDICLDCFWEEDQKALPAKTDATCP